VKRESFQVAAFCLLLFLGLPALADKSSSNVSCPVDTPYEDASGNPVSFEEKFGYDVLDSLRCNERRSNVRMVMQVNAYEVPSPSGPKPYGFRNLPNIINDMEITHGIENWRIAVVIHSGGWPFVSNDPAKNSYINTIEKYIDDPNVDIYYCLNTAAARGQTTEDFIDGIKFVPAGLSSIMDFQYQGYKYIQP
jgi:intracellular sulfur oxidation DsrE/DsrF family protein